MPREPQPGLALPAVAVQLGSTKKLSLWAQFVAPYRSEGVTGKNETNAAAARPGADGRRPLGASAAAATVGDVLQFKSSAEFGARIGLAPQKRSPGGKSQLGALIKRGDPYPRALLIQGAKSVQLQRPRRPTRSRNLQPGILPKRCYAGREQVTSTCWTTRCCTTCCSPT